MGHDGEIVPPIPGGWEKAGEFASFIQWVGKARSWIGGADARCFDAQGRGCRCGVDFMRAEAEGAFPVSFYIRTGGRGDG